MMTQQPTAPATQAPGNPIGYAPIYGPPPLAADVQSPPPIAPAKRNEAPLPVIICAAVVSGTLFGLAAWGWAFELYGGADVNALKRQVEAANATAIQSEHNAATAEANAQQWQAHSQTQEQTIEGVKALVCR